MSEISEWQGSLSRDWWAARTHLQASKEDREWGWGGGGGGQTAEALARGRGRARLLPTSPSPRERDASRGGLRLFWPGSQLQASPVTAHLPLQHQPQPGLADSAGTERGLCLPSPARMPTSKGLGGTFPGFLRETSCSGSSPEQRRATINAQTFLSMGVRPELELTGGEAVPRSSRAARGRC